MMNIRLELKDAVRYGKYELVKELINQYGLSYLSQCANGYILLRSAIEHNQTQIAKLLLDRGAKVNSNTSKRIRLMSPLHFAVQNADEDIIEIFLNKGANINQQNTQGFTPLLLAINNENEKIADLLIKKGASTSCATRQGTALHLAIRRGFLKMSEKLIKLGSCINSPFYLKGYTPLHCAVESNNKELTELLLNYGANANAKTENMETPLFIASEIGSVELIELLLKSNADIDANARNNLAPLYISVIKNHREAAKCLMDHGAYIDAEDKDGKTILNFSVENGFSMIVEDILQHLPNINNASNKKSLKIATKIPGKIYIPIVECLLKYGFSVEPDDQHDSKLVRNSIAMGYTKVIEDLFQYGLKFHCDDKGTFLQIAVESKQTEMVKLLLAHGADVNESGKDGKPPIYYSTQNSDLITTELLIFNGANIKKSPELIRIATNKVCKEIVELLLNNQADIEASDKFGRTALHLSVLNEYESYLGSLFDEEPNIQMKEEIARLLLSRGANVNAKTYKSGITALHIACKKGYINIVEVLLEYKADVNCLADDCTPLHIAARNGFECIIEKLIMSGANCNSKRENGETALHIAAKNGHLLALKALLKNCAVVDIKDNKGATPLHVAAEQEISAIVLYLMQQGASIDAGNAEGKTALHIAITKGNVEIIKLLLTHGSDINIVTNTNFTSIELAYYSRYSSTAREDFFHSDDENFDDYVDYDDGYNLSQRVIKMLNRHLFKLKAANLYINERNAVFLKEADDLMKSYEQNCKEEITKMKSEKIGKTKFNFYDILTKNINSLSKLTKNEEIIRILTLNAYKLNFPIYANIIERNIQKGIQRRQLLDHAHEIFRCYFELPFQCADEILCYLSDADLNNIIDL